MPVWRTASWSYLRFHEGRAAPRPCYGRAALATWVDRLRDTWGPDAEAWVYFNNDLHGHALLDAFDLAELLGHVPVHPPPEMRRPSETEESRTA